MVVKQESHDTKSYAIFTSSIDPVQAGTAYSESWRQEH